MINTGKARMASIVKSDWFGRNVHVLLVNGKRLDGELSEMTENYVVLRTKNGEMQIMAHAMMVVWPGSVEAVDEPPR